MKCGTRLFLLLYFLWLIFFKARSTCTVFFKEPQNWHMGTVKFTQSAALLNGHQNVSLCYYVASWTYWRRKMHLLETAPINKMAFRGNESVLVSAAAIKAILEATWPSKEGKGSWLRVGGEEGRLRNAIPWILKEE